MYKLWNERGSCVYLGCRIEILKLRGLQFAYDLCESFGMREVCVFILDLE